MYKSFTIVELTGFTKRLRVLYVEDNADAQEALLDLLSNFFTDIVIASDGEEGFKKFEAETFDLVISDIKMPKVDGIEMSRKIRDINCTIPIIIATAHKESQLLIKCIEVGVSAYLLKPISFKKLEKVIKQTCEKLYYMKMTEEYEKSLEKLVKDRTKELEFTKNNLEEMVNRDSMTNLYNRRYFYDISESWFKISQREKRAFSILMIDIDRFKNINDTYGHMAGDRVIRFLADVFKGLVRTSDVAVRFGGDEFVIFLPNTALDGAFAIANKIRESVEHEKLVLENYIIHFTVSIGVAESDYENDMDINDALHNVDDALYEAKRRGRNRVMIYKKKDLNE